MQAKEAQRQWRNVKDSLTADALTEMQGLPDTRSQVQALITETKARLGGGGGHRLHVQTHTQSPPLVPVRATTQTRLGAMLVDEGRVAQYHATRTRLTDEQTELQRQQQLLEERTTEMETRIDEWSRAMRDRVQRIGVAFKAGMDRLQVASKVELQFDPEVRRWMNCVGMQRCPLPRTRSFLLLSATYPRAEHRGRGHRHPGGVPQR